MNRSKIKRSQERTISLTAKLQNFSDKTVHKPRTRNVHAAIPKGSVIKYIKGKFYKNGNNKYNKGYVSLVFKCRVPLIFQNQCMFNFSCTVAVEDVNGERKFISTFTFPYDTALESALNRIVKIFSIDRYIARETLLRDPENLLSGDQLSLKVDIAIQTLSSADNLAEIKPVIDSSFEIQQGSDGPVILLNLKSELAQRLCGASSVFRAVCDFPMVESRTGLVHLHDDVEAFMHASSVVMGTSEIKFNSFEEIKKLYIFADKYDIQNVIRTCRKLCEKILEVENIRLFPDDSSLETFALVNERIHKISDLAQTFNDEILKEAVNRLLEFKTGGATETMDLRVNNAIFLGESHPLYFELADETDGSQFDFYK